MKIVSKKIARVALGAAVLGLLTAGGQGVLAQEKAKQVGKVVDIDGERLTTNRLSDKDKWYQAYQSMPTFFKERLQTDENTTATISFDVGGRAVISKGSKVEILNEDIVRLKSGTMWAKFDKEKLAGGGKKFQIETAGGVMGIEGTEFIVQTNPETGATELTMIEGTVDVDGNKVTSGERANFSNRAGYAAERFIQTGSPYWAIQDAALKDVDPAYRSVINRALWHVPGRYRWGRIWYGRNYWVARNVVRAFSDPSGAAVSMVTHTVPGGGIAGGLLRKATEPAKKPSRLQAKGATPTFSWSKSKRTDHYSVVVAEDSDLKDVVWYGRTKGNETKLKYPDYGPELTAGKTYYYLVSSLDGEGKPRANKRNGVLTYKTYFRGEGHTPTYGTVAGVEVKETGGAPKVEWDRMKDALGYKLTFRDSGGQVVWSGEVEGKNSYQYPETGRALAAGDYQVEIDAYDKSGLKMAKSGPTTFASSGWTAQGLANEGWEARAEETQGLLDETSAQIATLVQKAHHAVR